MTLPATLRPGTLVHHRDGRIGRVFHVARWPSGGRIVELQVGSGHVRAHDSDLEAWDARPALPRHVPLTPADPHLPQDGPGPWLEEELVHLLRLVRLHLGLSAEAASLEAGLASHRVERVEVGDGDRLTLQDARALVAWAGKRLGVGEATVPARVRFGWEDQRSS